MDEYNFLNSLSIIFTSAALFATLALYTRQSLLVSYIVLGVLLGPSGLQWITDLGVIRGMGDIGIIVLLFLLGLDLTPRELIASLHKTTLVTVVFSILFTAVGFAVGYLFGFTLSESVLIGSSLIFSSTIIGLKLLPRMELHHKPVGEGVISVLLLQDLLAIVMLLLVHGAGSISSRANDIGFALLILPLLLGFAFWVQRSIISRLFVRFESVKEYRFLLALAWCMGFAALTHSLKLSSEIGAFIAGVSIAEGPIAISIARKLKPLRDFCLIMFFFTIGASFNLEYLSEVIKPAIILAGAVLLLKPWLFQVLLCWSGEKQSVAQEVGVRLGQASEFSLLIAHLAAESMPPLIGNKANYLIQMVTILTFIGSSYWVVMRYPTPLAFDDKMRVD
jgi:Kef-type K+ transport system membrane component KefB